MPPAQPPSLRRNFALNAANLALNFGYALLSFAYSARMLGPSGMGRVGTAMALAAGLLLVSAMPLYGAKAVARVRDSGDRLDEAYSDLLVLQMAMTLLCAAGYAAAVLLVPAFRADGAVFAVIGAGLLLNGVNVDWLFAGLEDYRSLFIRNVAVKGMALAALFILVRAPGDILAFAFLQVGAAAAATLWGLAAASRKVRIRASLSGAFSHLRALCMVSGSSAAAGVYSQLDSAMLGAMGGAYPVGIYGAAIKLIRMSAASLAALAFTALPRLAHAAAGPATDDSEPLQRRTLRLSLFLAFPGAALLASLAPEIIGFISGPDFAEAVGLLRIAAPVVVLAAVANFIGMQILFPAGGERSLLLASLVGMACNIALNVALIPIWGAAGCAWAALCTEIAVLAALAAQARGRLDPFRGLGGAAAAYGIAAATSAAAAAWLAGFLDRPWLAAPAGLLAGGVFYVGMLGAAGDSLARTFLRLPVAVLMRGR